MHHSALLTMNSPLTRLPPAQSQGSNRHSDGSANGLTENLLLSDMSPNGQPKPGESLTISGDLQESRMVHQLPLYVKQLSPVSCPRCCTVQKHGMQDAPSHHVHNAVTRTRRSAHETGGTWTL